MYHLIFILSVLKAESSQCETVMVRVHNVNSRVCERKWWEWKKFMLQRENVSFEI